MINLLSNTDINQVTGGVDTEYLRNIVDVVCEYGEARCESPLIQGTKVNGQEVCKPYNCGSPVVSRDYHNIADHQGKIFFYVTDEKYRNTVKSR